MIGSNRSNVRSPCQGSAALPPPLSHGRMGPPCVGFHRPCPNSLPFIVERAASVCINPYYHAPKCGMAFASNS